MPIVDLRPPHERTGASILVCETTNKGAKQPDCKFACAEMPPLYRRSKVANVLLTAPNCLRDNSGQGFTKHFVLRIIGPTKFLNLNKIQGAKLF